MLGLFGMAGLVGCSSSVSSSGGGGNKGPTLDSIAVTCPSCSDASAAPAVTTGKSVQLKATGTYSDNSTQDLTSTATWSVDQTSVASVSGGNVTAVATGVATVTATSGSVKGSLPVDVTASTLGNGSMGPSYAFWLKFVDSRGQAMIVGSFATDSNGNITGGTVDYNTANGVNTTAVSLSSSTYTVLPDGRGEADIKLPSQTFHVAFALSQVNGSTLTEGKMISYDTNNAYGEFALQTAGANLTASSNYVFGFNGIDSQKNAVAEIGLFNTTSGSGSYDVDDNGVIDNSSTVTPPGPTSPVALSPVTIAAVGAGNRGTATLGSASFAYYTIDSTKAYFIETDTAAGTALAGTAELQTATETNTPNLSKFIYPLEPDYSPVDCYGDTSNSTALEPYCNYAFLLNHSASASNGTFEKAGQLDFCPCSGGGVNYDREDDAADGQDWGIGTGSRGFSTIGRGLISYPLINSTEKRDAIVYVVSNNGGSGTATGSSRMYIMNTDSGDTTPGVGVADFINAVPTDTPTAGSYVFSATTIGQTNLLELGFATFSGSTVSGIAYVNSNGSLSTVAINGSFAASTNTNITSGDGKGTISSWPINSGTTTIGAYSVGSNGLILYDSKTNINGRMEPQ